MKFYVEKKIKKYKHKPATIEAVQWDGTLLDGLYPITFFKQYNQGWHYSQRKLVIHTLEGEMTANVGDWIVRGIKGEFYPVKKELFECLYEAINE